MYVCSRLDAKVFHISQIGSFVEQNTMNDCTRVGSTYTLAQCSIMHGASTASREFQNKVSETASSSGVDALRRALGWTPHVELWAGRLASSSGLDALDSLAVRLFTSLCRLPSLCGLILRLANVKLFRHSGTLKPPSQYVICPVYCLLCLF